jgi:archaellum component FlaF (FlaF/FlaG flagellin family)
MTLSSLEITLIIIATLLAAAIVYAAFNYKKIVAKAVRRAHSQYSNLLREAEDEITRLKAVNSDIKHQAVMMKYMNSVLLNITLSLINLIK